MPKATASRTIALMWPSSAMCSGSRSSVQKAMRPGPYSASSGSRACRFRAAVASRISSHMPSRSRSRPSSTVYASWSERMPAAAYALRSRPRTPGAWPSTWWASASFASSDSLAPITPGKFIISARPITRRRRSSASRSPGVSSRRGDSNDDAGTHDDAMKKTSSGSPSVASISQCTPSVPSTFAISCGSATTAVVPSGRTRRANASGRSFDDSRCMWASMRPGTTQRPDASIDLVAFVVTEPGDEAVGDRDVDLEPLAREDAEDLPPRTTTSAGSSPRATASRLERDAGTAAEPYSPPDGRSSAPHARRGAAAEGRAPERASRSRAAPT